MSLPEEPHPLPDDPLLAEVARVLEAGRHTAEVLDSDWRLCYVTTELRQMCGVDDDDGLGYRVTSALRVLARPEAWRASRKSGYEWFQKETPYYLYDHGSEAVEPSSRS